MQKKFHQKAFTLIEMLIVIVIIGVLAAALIPRLTSVRDRANDVARKADLNQIATAIIARQMDHNGNLPNTSGSTLNAGDLSADLIQAGLDSVPQDPKTVSTVLGLSGVGAKTSDGQYGYMKVQKNGIPNSAFVVMAKMETPGASNRLYSSGGTAIADGLIDGSVETASLTPCKTVTKATAGSGFELNPGGDCYFDNYDQLRFIIVR